MRIRRLYTRWVPIVSTVLVTAASAWAQSDAQAEIQPDLQAQLTRLNKNIERIADMMNSFLEGQRLELMIQRVEMGASRLSSAEESLRKAKATRASIEHEKTELEARLAQIADQLDQGLTSMTADELDSYTREIDLQLRLMKDRTREADRQIIELENEVMQQRANVRDWEDSIDRLLERDY